MKISGLDIKRKANLKSIENNKKYDLIELHSRNIVNSSKILENNQNFELFLDIVGANDRDINKLFINYHLLNPNSEKAEVVKDKVNGIYEKLKTGINDLENQIDNDLGIKFTIKAKENDLIITQSYNKYELDKIYLNNMYDVENSLNHFKTNREDIGKIIKDKLDKEYNVVREMVEGNDYHTEYRVKDVYLPKINKTVFVIDRKRTDFNENKEDYWETVDSYTDIEALGNLAMLKKRNLIKENKLELNKNLNEKDIADIVNTLENPKIQKLLSNEKYFEIANGKAVNMKKSGLQKFADTSANIGIFASFIVMSAFKDKYIKNDEKGNYEIDEKVLERDNILVKRALNITSEFAKNNKEIEEFINSPKSNLINISALSLSEIEVLEKSPQLSTKIKRDLEERKTFLEKYAVIDGLRNSEGENTAHIQNLSEIEALIDLYDGNTSPEQRRLLELKLLEYAEKHKKEEKEKIEEIKKIIENKENHTLLYLTAGLVLGTIQEVAENGNRIDNQVSKSTVKFSALLNTVINIEENMEEYNRKDRLAQLLKEQKEKEKNMVKMAQFFDPKFAEEIAIEKNISEVNDEVSDFKEEPPIDFLEKAKENGMLIGENGYYEKNQNFSENGIKDYNSEFLKINKAMADAHQSTIDYNMAKTQASVLNIKPNGDVFIEMQLLKNSPERIYNDGMKVLKMENTKPINIIDKLINSRRTEESKNIIEKKLDDKVMENTLKNVPTDEINTKLDNTFKELKTNIIEMDLHEKETYKAINRIKKDEDIEKTPDKTIIIDYREKDLEIEKVAKEVATNKEKVVEKKEEVFEKQKVAEKQNTSNRVYKIDDKVEKANDFENDFEDNDIGGKDFW